jgi:catechol 2,3-dioxygenase-like lactoylglutathione lyase family enzyme
LVPVILRLTPPAVVLHHADGVRKGLPARTGRYLGVPFGHRAITGSPMRITASAVSLNVDDVEASSAFLSAHFGFREDMAAPGFASLSRPDAGLSVIFLRRGLATLPADQRDERARGQILAFVVDDLEGELARLQQEGVTITMPLTTEEWGERAFQVRDPNGLILQLVDWNGETSS